MRIVDIRDKLREIGSPVDSLALGDFDAIGEFTAKKARDPASSLYRTAGCFFRPNYERGLLVYSLIRRFDIASFLEIGTGRGYTTVCAAKAMFDSGIRGNIVTVDVAHDTTHMDLMSRAFPHEWLSMIKFVRGKSCDVVPTLGKFGLVYIDGDHSYEGVKSDWQLIRDRYEKFAIFDDYHLPTHPDDPGIMCAKAIDEIADPSKELILMDRRVFADDRRLESLDYGQVMLTRIGVSQSDGTCDW